jgi:DNA-binding transcriptional LysR family regulator
MNFTLHQLKVFTQIVKSRSVSKAAELLHMTQPAVSIQLRNLQDQFEIPLTEVIGRKLHITDFGFEMARQAEEILQSVAEIQQKAQQYKGLLAGALRIDSVSTGKYILPHFLTGFLKKNPYIDLSLEVSQRENVIRSLEENRVDFALVSVVPEHLEVNEEQLMPNRLFLVASAGFSVQEADTEEPVPWQHLPIILREKGSGTRWILEQHIHRHHINPPQVKFELASTEAVKQAVVAGLGVSVLSVYAMKFELKENILSVIPFPGFPLLNQWRLIWLKDKKLSPVAQAYLEYIRTEKGRIYENNFKWAEAYG